MSNKQIKRLIVIDISNFIFRAFFAIRPLNAPDGTPVNAVYGVLSMILKLFADHRPTHVFVARDSKEKSFRGQLYPEYKANRQAPPEELIPQFPLVEQLLDRMSLPELMVPGFEADDIIGSAATQWRPYFDEILIATGDKDIMQFVDDRVKVIDTMKDKIFGPKEVFEKMGVHPHQIVDYLSMLGDSSDNIPGMKGIGEKGAAKLLEEYGSLDECIKNVDKLSNKRVKAAFDNHLEDALLSKKLVEIITNIDLGKTVDQLSYSFYPSPELLTFLKTLGMNRMVEKLNLLQFNESTSAPENSGQKQTSMVVPPQVDENFKTISKLNDLETLFEIVESGPDQWGMAFYFPTEDCIEGRIEAIGLHSTKSGSFIISFVPHIVESELEQKHLFELLNKLLSQPNNVVIGHDIKELYYQTYKAQIKIRANLRDILLESYLVNVDENHSIEFLASHHLGASLPGLDLNLVMALHSRAQLIPQLAKHFSTGLERFGLNRVLNEIEMPLIPVLAEMELEGVRINPKFLLSLETKFTDEVMEIATAIEEKSGGTSVNLNSPKQVRELLFEKLQLPVIKTTKTGPSTDSEVLEKLTSMGLSEIPGLILRFREIDKLLSTYISVLPKMINPHSGKIHAHFNQTGTTTGRLSCDRPNLQNIPIKTEYGRLVRKAFVASPGSLLLSADYSQVELRILAHFSEDPTMVKAFLNNEDIHVQTAAEVFEVPLTSVTKEQRNAAKAINFGLMYGQSSFGLSQSLNISRQEAKDYITNYFHKFSQVKSYLDGLIQTATEKGYCETLFGRKRFLADIRSQNRTIKSMAERLAINSPIQGTAADIIKLAMINISHHLKANKLKSKFILQVHDELIFEVPEEEIETMKNLVRSQMENCVLLKVPLRVDMGFGVNWYDIK